MSDARPENCRNRLRDEGRGYPRSGCEACEGWLFRGCPHEPEQAAPIDPKDAEIAHWKQRAEMAEARLDELEGNEQTLREMVDAAERKRDEVVATLKQRAETAEAALRFYANPEVYKPHPHGPAFDRRDLSDVAIRALRQSESGS